MKKEKIILPVGNNKVLVYEVTPGNEQEQEFARQCKAVAATRPGSIQDFFIELVDLQRRQHRQQHRKKGKGI
ncbi:MAG: hypothetical protein J0H29_09710 [Sphingobacteriales bacterium]|nr:hypothetical protein [Sphingobacteriales bacterium]OJY90098.1 MAG: hypothetical protein BGP14_10355 [Sphingobacteriales bacterium 44-15]